MEDLTLYLRHIAPCSTNMHIFASGGMDFLLMWEKSELHFSFFAFSFFSFSGLYSAGIIYSQNILCKKDKCC